MNMSDQLNEAKLQCCMESDTEQYLRLVVSKDCWIERAGQVIGDSKSLRYLDIEIPCGDKDGAWLGELMLHLPRNRSIWELRLCLQPSSDTPANFYNYELEWDIFQMLRPFIENNSNLEELYLDGGTTHMLSSLSLALLSCKNKRLNRIYLRDIEAGGDFGQMFRSLAEYRYLDEITLISNDLGEEGCKALSQLIQHRNSLYDLRLVDNEFDDDCIAIMCDGLIKNNNIRNLELRSNPMTATGWKTLCTVFSNHPNWPFETVSLAETDMDDEGVTLLGKALAEYNALDSLDLSFNNSITLKGWQGFFNYLRSPNFPLETLKLGNCSIGDEGVVVIMEFLKRNVRMKGLSLDSSMITSRGLRTIFDTLLAYETTIQDLDLLGNDIDFGEFTADDVRLISRTLCDKTSIENTYYSKHIGCKIRFGKFDDNVDKVWYDIQSSLEMEAYEKIWKHHFSGKDTDLNVFARMPDALLPYAIEWIGRYRIQRRVFEFKGGFSLMYQFIGGFPTLFNVQNHRPNTAGFEKKRKRSCNN